jgi:outer membrane protein assembly factor BamB/tetratricopeptide (TPR) repeat protein
MNAVRRVAVTILAGLSAVLCWPGLAAPQEANRVEDALAGSLSLLTDKRTTTKLEAAADYAAEEDWKNATGVYQNILDMKQDVLVRLKAPGAKAPRPGWYASARAEAERQLAALPAAGREFYQLTYGPQAAALLAQARQNKDADLLARVAQRFLYTEAGPAALQALAHQHYRADRLHVAAACYARLLDHLGLARWPAENLYEATVAFRRTGDHAHAELTLKQLLVRADRNVLRLGGRERSAEELRKELDRAAPAPQSRDWHLFGGNVERSAQAAGGTPFLVPRWKSKLLHTPEGAAQQKLNQAAKVITNDRHQPLLTAFSPIVVTVTKREQTTPVLVYKDYWGVNAINMKAGKLEWDSPSNWSLERMLGPRTEARKQQAITQWLQYYLEANVRPQILFENSVVDTSTTDGKYVYVVEDLAVPPPPDFNPRLMNPGLKNLGISPEIQDAIQHSRLQAFTLVNNGKLTWEVGERGDLSDCHFRAPPLPLDGKLYMLTEKKEELRVVCLDPDTRGKLVWSQPLASAKTPLVQDPIRRTQAAHLACGGGVLVCPTNAGAVFGLDLLTGRILWAYPYGGNPPPAANPGRVGGLPTGWVIGPDGRPMRVGPAQANGWKVTAPIIQDGKVVFTPPDEPSIHCVNLRDGSPVWSQKKLDDDLYLGGVYAGKVLVVGKKSVRGLSLANGQTLWTLETGLPSGQGIASDNVYYLPLKEAGRDREPEICAIDINKGRIVSHARSRPRTPGGNDFEVPGNLLFFEGDLISQTPWEITAYPQLKVKIAQMDDLLSKNPNDPVGLTERGELRLDKSDLVGAIEDLRKALENKPNDATRARARARLYAALTELLQRDFKAGEKYLKDYEGLCKVDAEEAVGQEAAARRAEQKRRRVNFFVLVGKGREQQGRLLDALKAYLEIAALAGAGDLMPVAGEPGVKVRPDVWAHNRIADLLQKAPPEKRKELEEEITRRLKKAQARDDPDDLRAFVALFGPESAAGREARLTLAERLIAKQQYAEADRLLQEVRRRRDDPTAAARALLMLGQLMTRRGLLPDAVHYYRILGRDYPKTVLPDGKTGAEILDGLSTDKRFLPFLERPAIPPGKIEAPKVEHGSFPMPAQVYHFAHTGEDLPFFQRYTLGLRFDNHDLKLTDRGSGEERWRRTITKTMMANLVNANGQGSTLRFPFLSLGHLIVLPVGHTVYGLDADSGEIRWWKDLDASDGAPGRVAPNGPQFSQVIVDPHDNSLLVLYPDGWAQRLGADLVASPSVVCLSSRDGLQGVDTLTGRTLWVRSNVSPRHHLFGDGEYLCVVEENADGQPRSTRVFRTGDGTTVRAPAFATLFGKRVQVHGRELLLSEKGEGDRVTLRLYDVLTGQDVWKHTYPARSIVLHSEDPALTGVVAPNGTVHVVDLRARKEVLSGKMAEPGHLAKVETVHLLADRENFYLACQARTQDETVTRFGGIQSNLMPSSGMRCLPINGMLYAFEKRSGEIVWSVPAPNQMLVLDQFADLPVVLLTSRYQKLDNVGFRNQVHQVVALMVIEKQVGKVLFESKDLKNATNFYAIHIDVRAGRIEFISPNLKLHCFQYGVKPAPGK